MERDHARLDALLADTVRTSFEPTVYNEFRRGLLRHISIEEKLLFPLLKSRAELLPVLSQLRSHHGALAALLIPKGTDALVRAITAILKVHNRLEEGASGIYAQIAITSEEDDALQAKLAAFPDVPLSPAIDKLTDMGPVRRAMERAGFDLQTYLLE